VEGNFAHPDYDQHYWTGRQTPRFEQRFALYEQEQQIRITDPIWGPETIGTSPEDAIFLELAQHPVFARLASVQQLTLPEHYTTIPGTGNFSRWEHAWGSLVFVRKMVREARERGLYYDPRESMLGQVRTFDSDSGHRVGSHLYDWLTQGFGGNEDNHDLTLPEYLEEMGVTDVFRGYGYRPEEVIFPDVEDWIECPSPDLCVDRVDYGAREITRWVDPGSEMLWRDAFMLDDKNRLVMRNKAVADRFALSFGLLATEHWSHPVHRLQLQLFSELVKGAILDGSDMVTHPVDSMFTIDDMVIATTRGVGTLNSELHALLLDIGRSQRRIFAWGRERAIQDFLEAERGSRPFLHPLDDSQWYTEYSMVKPQTVELIPVAADDTALPAPPHLLRVHLPRLKPRSVDPLYMDGDTVKRVSDDPVMAQLIDQHRAIQAQAYDAHIYLAPDAADSLRRKISAVQTEWEARVRRPRSEASAASLPGIVRQAGLLAITGHSDTIRFLTSSRYDDPAYS
jgi:hypothetical protein